MSSTNNTTALAQQQNDLLHAIFATNKIAFKAINTLATSINSTIKQRSTRGLQTYQANAAASAQRSLQTAYPVIAQLIGNDSFAHLARDFWAQHPPTRGDLAQWGAELSGFIASIPALQTEPYLGDVARAEWALHRAATAADQAADLATLSLLTDRDPDAITLQLAPGTAIIDGSFPVASILAAHLFAHLADQPNFEDVGQKLRQNVAETALIWRQGLRPMVASCTAGEAVFVSQLLAGKSLLAAIDAALSAESVSFDFSVWLPHAVQSGLLLGARLM